MTRQTRPEDDDLDDEEEDEDDESGDSDTDTSTRDSNREGDDNDDLNMSLAALEDAVRGDVMALFDEVGACFKEFSRVKAGGWFEWLKNRVLSPNQKLATWTRKFGLRIDGRGDFQR